MSGEDESKLANNSQAMYLLVVGITWRLDVLVLVSLMSSNEIPQARYERLVVLFCFPICLGMMRSNCEVFRTVLHENKAKNFAVNCGPLSVKMLSGIPYGLIQLATKASATNSTAVLCIGIALINLQN